MTSSRQLWRRLRTPLLVGSLHLTRALATRLSWSAAQRWGRRLGRLAWSGSHRDRRRTLRHLAIAFPDLDEARRRTIGRGAFEHLGVLLLECLHLASRDCSAVERHVAIAGLDILRQAQHDERPVVAFTGHCGNWELLAASLSCAGVPLSVVVRQLDEPSLDTLLVGLRSAFGTRSVGRGTSGAARELLRALRRGDVLGLLIDQDTEVEGCWVPFFGRPAYTPTGAAQLALGRDAVVVPVFSHRRGDGSHSVRVHERLELPDDVVAATALMTRLIEGQIRRHPEQWVWMHRRWRRQPSD